MAERTDDEYIEPSTGARVLLGLYVALLALLIVIVRAKIAPASLGENPSAEQLDQSLAAFGDLVDYLLVFTVVHALPISAYFGKLAHRSMKTGQFPPRGTSVVVRTRILRGRRAVRSAYACYFMALLAWFPVLIPVYLHWVFREIA